MIVFVTAEPYGAYHLQPFSRLLPEHAYHLVPGHDTPQGHSEIPTVCDLGIIEVANLVVIVGGAITPWTEAVALEASRHNVPIAFSELAYLPTDVHPRGLPHILYATAGSPAGQALIANHLSLSPDKITVIGYPALDGIENLTPPSLEREKRRVLILGGQPDHLQPVTQDTIAHLRAAGHDVTIRLHPRADRTLWTGTETSHAPLIDDLATHDVAVGVPGTAFIAAAAAGRPLVAIAGTGNIYTPWEFEDLGRSATPADMPAAAQAATAPDPEVVHNLTGPVGGAAERLAVLWSLSGRR